MAIEEKKRKRRKGQAMERSILKRWRRKEGDEKWLMEDKRRTALFRERSNWGERA
jgi:hypothetical protein